jgi:hypothetical protein
MAISLFPTPFPVDHYNYAKELQPLLGTLLSNMVKDPKLIWDSLQYFYDTDPFVKKLIDISKSYSSLNTNER